jgi:integrase
MKASIIFFPWNAKKSSKTGKTPLYMRVNFNGAKAETRLNAELTESDLLLWDEFTMRFRDRKHPLNGYLNALDKQFADFRILNATAHLKYTAQDLRDYIIGVSPKEKEFTLIDYIDKYYQSTVLPNTGVAIGTKKNYKKAINHFKSFLVEKNLTSLVISELSVSLAFDFKDYLLSSSLDGKKVGLTEPSALGNVKKFRTIFDRAIDEGLLDKNPFKRIKLKSHSPMRGRLGIAQVKQLYDLDLSEFSSRRLYRDLFIFSTITGLAYNDSMSLLKTNLSDASDNNVRLMIKRGKTDVVTEMILTKYAIEIINRYKQHPETQIKTTIFPKRSNKEVNVQLKVLGGLIDVPIKLTTHIGRHTFRQLLAEAGIVDFAVIKRMMGHSRKNEIDEVYYSVTESALINAKQMFEKFLDKHLVKTTE